MIEHIYNWLSFWDIAYMIVACATMGLFVSVGNESFGENPVAAAILSLIWPITLAIMLFAIAFTLIHELLEWAFGDKR